ncbi:MAG TPA: hypothetical protein VHQ01_07290, partial [Pyrinomonadaceae bacterium]|nr:hypothetical protein [Pyrinomonadaceae bacterium]
MKISHTLRFVIGVLLLQSFVLPAALFAQDAKLADVNAAIRKEGMENSKVMHTLHILTDLYGPRLTGSPNHVNAAKWAAREMTSWGFDKTALEPWEFGHPGWVDERNIGLMLKPVQDTLTFETLAWTPSTKGEESGEAVSLVVPTFPSATNPNVMQQPTQEELTAYLDSMRSAVAGKMVLVGKPTFIPQDNTPGPKRLNDEDNKKRYDPANAAGAGGGGGRPGGGQGRGAGGAPPAARPGALSAATVGEQVDKFLLDNGVLVRINESQLDRGAVRAFNNRTFDITKVVPTVVMRNEDFGRIYRLLADKT